MKKLRFRSIGILVPITAKRITMKVTILFMSLFCLQPEANASFSIKEKTISLTSVDKKSFQNQQILVKGNVKDDQNLNLPGVTIKVKNGKAATISDLNGNFSIRANRGDILQFSYISFADTEVKVTSETINVSLKLDNKKLEEVVVIGYGTVNKSDLTGSVTSIKLSENNENKVVSVSEALQGKVAGVNIYNNTGEPGSGMTFNIRGTTSITGTNSPLIVLDGVPIESELSATSAGINIDWQSQTPPLDPLASLNPADIESVEILKDASATAIYGSRGANGVVLITTKGGKSSGGRDKISYNFRSDFSRLPKKIEMADALTYMLYRNEARMNDGAEPLYTQAEIRRDAELHKDNVWQDMIYKTAKSQDHQITASGSLGDEKRKGNYRLSANYSDNQSVINNAGFQRGSVRFNFDKDITEKLSISFRSNLALTYRKFGAQSNTQGVIASSAVMGALISSPIRAAFTDDGELDLEFANNPALVTMIKKDHTTSGTVISAMDLEYKLAKGLTYKIKGSINQISTLRQVYWPRGTFQGDQYGGSATRADNVSSNYLTDHLLTYKRTFNKSHRINAVAGYSYQKWYRKSSSITSTGFPNDNLGYENFALAESPGTTYTYNRSRALSSVLGRINYSYASRYLLTLTGRSDGASRLAPGHKWNFFPSVGLGWNASNETFFKNNFPSVSNLKFRASYGVAGSENIGIGATQTTYSIDRVVFGSILPGLNYDNFENKFLTWERTTSYNLGVDLGLFRDKVTLTADIYQKTTNDLLINLAIPMSSTFSSYSTNTGEVYNKGLDLDAKVTILKKKDLNWSAFGNYSIYRNKIVSMGEASMIYGGTYLYGGNSNLNQPLQVAKVGEPISSFWAYRTAGIYQNPIDVEMDPNIEFDPNKSNIRPGDVRFLDMNKDGMITDADKTIVGKPNPDFSVGFGSDLSYKKWTFSFAFLGNFGQELINLNQWLIGSLTTIGSYNTSMDAWNNRWQGEGTSNKYPRATNRDTRFGNRFPDYMIEDASFLRLQSVNLGYNFSLPRLSATSNLRVFASGTNLFTITDYSGYDPNVNSQGNFALMTGTDYGTLPQSRTFSLGVILNY